MLTIFNTHAFQGFTFKSRSRVEEAIASAEVAIGSAEEAIPSAEAMEWINKVITYRISMCVAM